MSPSAAVQAIMSNDREEFAATKSKKNTASCKSAQKSNGDGELDESENIEETEDDIEAEDGKEETEDVATYMDVEPTVTSGECGESGNTSALLPLNELIDAVKEIEPKEVRRIL